MKICVIVILIFFSLKAFAQDTTHVRENCDFLKNLHFINGADTIVLKARYSAIYSQGVGLILEDLEKKKKLNAKILKNSIGFEIINCTKHYMVPYHFKNKAAMDLLENESEGTIIYLTCIVYEGYYNYGEPFFIIDKLDIKNSN